MGTKQTKIESNYLPDTPVAACALQHKVATESFEAGDSFGHQDPRSPNGRRTPIATFAASTQQNTEQSHNKERTSAYFPPGMMRKGFFKGLIYNLSDPRSPTIDLNRTPLTLEETNNRTLDLNDTFADLFVESRISHNRPVDDVQMAIRTPNKDVKTEFPSVVEANCVEQQQTEDFISEVKETALTYNKQQTMLCPMVMNQTPVLLQQHLDPRSPTIGVERTPITFKVDDNESNENRLLESLLATNSLNISGISCNTLSNILDSTRNMPPSSTNSIIAKLHGDLVESKPANKHLDCVRVGRKRLPRKRICRPSRQQIYEDTENESSLLNTTLNVTPKSKAHGTVNGSDKRTPLSCMKNRSLLRSRSMETSTKSLKARLPVTSSDDILNPVQIPKVDNNYVLLNSESSSDF